MNKILRRAAAVLLALCLIPGVAPAEPAAAQEEGWVNFLLLCNEGMNNQ